MANGLPDTLPNQCARCGEFGISDSSEELVWERKAHGIALFERDELNRRIVSAEARLAAVDGVVIAACDAVDADPDDAPEALVRAVARLRASQKVPK